MSDYVTYEHLTTTTSAIKALTIELTERCNLNCRHCCINCPKDDTESRKQELSTEVWMHALSQAANLGCRHLCMTGGEPLVRQDFEVLYLYAQRLGYRVQIFTNGTLINPQNIALWQRLPPQETIEVSVYGMSIETYDAVTQTPGAYQLFRQAISQLQQGNIPFILKYVCLPTNLHELDAFEVWQRETQPTPVPCNVPLLRLRDRRDDQNKNETIRSLRLSPSAVLEILRRDEVRYAESANAFADRFAGKTKSCGYGSHICIDAYGRVQPCPAMRDPSRSVAVFGEHAPPGLTLQDALTVFEKDPCNAPADKCATCPLYGFCEQCPALAWIETGDARQSVDYYCQVAHTQARWLGWLSR